MSVDREYRCGSIDTRKLHGRSRQQGGGRRRLQDSLRGDHLRRGPPIPGGPVEAREQAAENDGTSRQSERPSRDAGGDTSTNKIYRGAPRAETRSRTISTTARQGQTMNTI